MGLLEAINKQKNASEEAKEAPKEQEQPDAEQVEEADPYAAYKKDLYQETVTELNENYSPEAVDQGRDKFVRDTISNLIVSRNYPIPLADRPEIVNSITSDIIGLGPLDKLLEDPDISEIMVNGPDRIYVESHGKLQLSKQRFRDNAHVMTIIDRIVTPLGRHIDESSPMVDARLADGSRVNAIIPPLALNGPVITIRKFPKDRLSANDLIKWGSASPRMLQFLEACVKGRMNCIVSGGTGSGKCLSRLTQVICTDGDGRLAEKAIGDLKPGDHVIQRNGTITTVTGVYPQGVRDVWSVKTKDGKIAECSDDHQWIVAVESHGTVVERVMTTAEMYNAGVIRVKHNKDGDRRQAKFWLPRAEAVNSAKQTLPIDPYVMGYLIGNGSLTSGSGPVFSTNDQYVVDKISDRLNKGSSISKISGGIRYYISNAMDIMETLDKLHLTERAEHKFIPEIYMHASKEQRFDLLRGLMDADGYCAPNGTASYSTVSKRLAEDVAQLAETLGFSTTTSLDVRDDKYERTNHTAYQVFVLGGHDNPFSLPRKADRWDANHERKHSARIAQTYTDCAEDGMSYLAGYLYQAKIIAGVPCIADRRIDHELMERLISYLPEGSILYDQVEGSGYKIWKIKSPSVSGTGVHNGITLITKVLGYSGVSLMNRLLPGEKYINASFLRGLADFCGNIHGGDLNFTLSDGCLDEVEKVLDKVGLQYSRQKGEIVIHNYPSTLLHKSDKVQLLRNWEEGSAGNFNLRNDYVPIVEITKTDRQDEMVCIKVDDDSHTFVLANGMVTHNTTLLNILSAYIPATERIVTIEDAAELQLQQDHVVRLESRPANTEGKGRIAIKDLVINALRMRPDRIIVGECRGGEALDMLQAMNTGHDGSLTTGHANSPRDIMSRLETMVMMAGEELPEKAIREQIASAINIVIQQSRLRDGSRKIVSISEVTGMEGDEIVMQEIFRFRQTGIDDEGHIQGVFEATGVRPNCIDKLMLAGCGVRDDWFKKGEC